MTNSTLARRGKKSWTCTRCDMTVGWMPGHDVPKLPAHWSKAKGRLHCLACRREVAAEDRAKKLPEGTNVTKRAQIMTEARLDFEVTRAPERGDAEIAKSCKSTVASVKKARERLGVA
jgi:hypothetical protein